MTGMIVECFKNSPLENDFSLNNSLDPICTAAIGQCNTYQFAFYKKCKCIKSWNVNLWSIKKEVFLPSITMLPKGFAFLTGCSTAIDRNRIILIGGHYVLTYQGTTLSANSEMIVKYPSNDQVVEFNTLNRKWTYLQKVPISNVISKNHSKESNVKIHINVFCLGPV